MVISASDRFQHPTRSPNELWQSDFTYIPVVSWRWYYLSTVLDGYSRKIPAWKLPATLGPADVTGTLDLARVATGLDRVRAELGPRLSSLDRASWVALHQLRPRWREVPMIVRPETVVRWHHKGFHLYWRAVSRRAPGRPRIRQEFVIDHGRRSLIHFNVTKNPSARWVIQQLREAFPSDCTPRYLLLDRDSIFSAEVMAAIRSIVVDPVRTAYRGPWQNPIAERWVGRLAPRRRDPPPVRLGGGGVAGPRVHSKTSSGPADES